MSRSEALVDHYCGGLGQKAGLGLDKIRAHSRHATLATLTIYIDDHNRRGTKWTLADLVASTISA